MRIVAAFSTPTEAHLARSRLEGAGIPAEIRDQFTVEFNWLLSNAVGGVKVAVDDDNYNAAREILAMPPLEDGITSCPHCGSNQTGVRTLSVFGALCVVLKLPIPMTRAIVDCHKCGKTHDVPLSGSA